MSELTPNLKSAVRQQLGVAGPYTDKVLEAVKVLHWTWDGEPDLARFPNLRSIMLSKAPANALSALHRCDATHLLVVDWSAVDDLSPVQRLPNLDDLTCPMNAIHDLGPVMELPRLKELDVTANPLSEYSYLEILPKLREAGVEVRCSPEREWRVSLKFWEAGFKGHWYQGDFVLPGPGLREDEVNRTFEASLDEAEEVLQEKDLTLDRLKELFQRRHRWLERYVPPPPLDRRLAIIEAETGRRRLSRLKLPTTHKRAAQKFLKPLGHWNQLICVTNAGLEALKAEHAVPKSFEKAARVCVGVSDEGPIVFAKDSPLAPHQPFEFPVLSWDGDAPAAGMVPLAKGAQGTWLALRADDEKVCLVTPGDPVSVEPVFDGYFPMLAAIDEMLPEPDLETIDTSHIPIEELLAEGKVPYPSQEYPRDDELIAETGDTEAALGWISASKLPEDDKKHLRRFVRRFPNETFGRYPKDEVAKMTDWNTGKVPPALRECLGALAGIEPGVVMRCEVTPQEFTGDQYWIGPHRWPEDMKKAPAGVVPIGQTGDSLKLLVWIKSGGQIEVIGHEEVYEKGFKGRGAHVFDSYAAALGAVVEIEYPDQPPIAAK